MTFTIEGAPSSKKTSQRMIPGIGGRRPILLQSRQYLAWERSAVLQLKAQFARLGLPTSAERWNLRALFYLNRKPGRSNLDNFIAGVSDALERSGVVRDDCQLAGYDGSRLLVDKQRPRVEVTLTPMED